MDSIEAGGSALGRPGLDATDRRQLLYLDAVRTGDVDAAEQLASSDVGPPPWQVKWASATDLDPRLHLKLHVGPVLAMTWGVHSQRPLIAVCTGENDEYGGGPRYRLRVWDVLSGHSRSLPCAEPSRCLSFALMDDDAVLVSGHEEGWLRIWGVTDSSLRREVDTGDDHLEELHVVESGQRTQVVTRDVRGRVQRWSLHSGEPLGVMDTPPTFSMSAGLLADGRRVLLTGGDGLSLWDLDDGRRLPLRIPQEFSRARGVVLSTVAGRDCATLVSEVKSVATFDLDTGTQTSGTITAHVNRRPDGLMRMWSAPDPHARLAVVSGTLAVPTRWRIHLWNLNTSQEVRPPLAGPAGQSVVQSVRWQGRDLLLTGSTHDGVVALWDLEQQPVVRAPGHDEPVSRVVSVEPADVVVSADQGGAIIARDSASGGLVAAPLQTGIEGTQALASWLDGRDLITATGAGSAYVKDGNLRQWNVSTGDQHAPPIPAHRAYLHCISRIRLQQGEALVTFGPGKMLKIWRLPDCKLVAEVETEVLSKVTGFATGVIDGRAWVGLSSYSQPMTLYALDDLTAPPIFIPEAGNDVVLDIVGSHVVAARPEYEHTGLKTVRVWKISGGRIGPDIHNAAEITSAAGRAWPAVYIGRADGSVALTDVETGHDLCLPMLLPSRPSVLSVTADGDLVVGFGSDVARVRPPVR
ncbi:WD40 repeat domain-containing protein [Micromonospora sp. NPDC004704]